LPGKIAALPTEVNSECDTALFRATGSSCKNGGVCSFRRADCTDADAPFDTPVCSCGAPTGTTCFYGQFCEEKVDACPDGTNMCNIVKSLNAEVDPVSKVCSAEKWPKRLCIEGAPSTGGESSALGDNDEEEGVEEVESPSSSSKVGGAVAGVMGVGLLLIVIAILYQKHASHNSTTMGLAESGLASSPMHYKDGTKSVTNPMYSEMDVGEGSYLEPRALDGAMDVGGGGGPTAEDDGFQLEAEFGGNDVKLTRKRSVYNDGGQYDAGDQGSDAYEPPHAMSDVAGDVAGADGYLLVGSNTIHEPEYDTGTLVRGTTMEQPTYDGLVTEVYEATYIEPNQNGDTTGARRSSSIVDSEPTYDGLVAEVHEATYIEPNQNGDIHPALLTGTMVDSEPRYDGLVTEVHEATYIEPNQNDDIHPALLTGSMVDSEPRYDGLVTEVHEATYIEPNQNGDTTGARRASSMTTEAIDDSAFPGDAAAAGMYVETAGTITAEGGDDYHYCN
jgi:hypothetical protein